MSNLHEASAEFGFFMDSNPRVYPAFDGGPDHRHVLWHTEADLQNDACDKRPVVVSSQPWLPNSLTWHPNPAAQLYDVLDEKGKVYLVSGLSHKCVQTWTPSPLCNLPPQLPPGACSEGRLQWSPDGTVLAVTACAGKANTFLCYGSSV